MAQGDVFGWVPVTVLSVAQILVAVLLVVWLVRGAWEAYPTVRLWLSH